MKNNNEDNISVQKDKKSNYRNRIIYLVIAAAEILCAIGIFKIKSIYLSSTRSNGHEIIVIMPIFLAVKIFSASINIAAACIKHKTIEKAALIMSFYCNAAVMLISILILAAVLLMAVTFLPALIFQDFYERLASIGTYFFFNFEFFIIPFLISLVLYKRKV